MTRVTMEGRVEISWKFQKLIFLQTKILSVILDIPTMSDQCNMLDGVLGGLKVMQNFQRWEKSGNSLFIEIGGLHNFM